jgi:hypothetical protein
MITTHLIFFFFGAKPAVGRRRLSLKKSDDDELRELCKAFFDQVVKP